MRFSSGLFILDLDSLDPSQTVAWAECEVDLMGQPIVRFHAIVADGFGANTYGWYDILFLRVDHLAGRLDLVIDVEGEWSIEGSFEIEELYDALVDARAGKGDSKEIFDLMLEAASSRLRVRSVTDDDVARFDGLPIDANPRVEDEVRLRGCWEPGRRTRHEEAPHGQPPFPYAVIRHFSAVYERVSVRFTVDEIEASFGSGALLVHEPLDHEQPAEDRRTLLVDRLVELSEASGRKVCAVFGPTDAIYVEPNGARRSSTEIPQGGIDEWPGDRK